MDTTTQPSNMVLAIREALGNNNSAKAEDVLVLIADGAGDEQLAIIVQELSPLEVMALATSGDYTKPSLVAHFVSPEQFIGAILRIGAKWGAVGDADGHVLEKLNGELADLLLSVLLIAEMEKRQELLNALVEHSLGMRTLICVAIGVREFVLNYDSAMAEKGTAEELLTHLEEINFDAFTALQKKIISLCRENTERYDSEEGEEPRSVKECNAYLRRTLNSLVESAMELVEKEPAKAEEEEVFRDI